MTTETQIIHCGPHTIDGGTLRTRAASAASGFLSLGLRPSDTVAVMLRNDLPYLELMLALDRIGVHLVAINWHFRAEEAGYILRDCGARVFVVHADLWPNVRNTVPQGTVVLMVPTPADVTQSYGLDTVDADAEERFDWETWRDGFAPCEQTSVPSVGSMLYTSGTTGRPKAVMRLPGTPAQHDGSVRIRSLSNQARVGMRTAIAGPLYHAGPNAAARAALAQAECIVVLPHFDAEDLLRTIESYRLTHLMLVPIMFVRLLKLPPEVRSRYDLSSLENVTHGGSPCAPHVKRQMLEWWGPIISETYGSTEAGLVTLVTAGEWLKRPGTVGRAFPGTSIRILDDNGDILPPREVGEIYVNPGDNALPFTYRNNAEQRRAAERDGHFTNGDVGYLDEQGYLFVTDRKRDMVISGAVNIYPAEIEHALMASPEVADCAVFGIPDPEYGEALAAVVVAASGQSPTTESLRAWLYPRIARYKVPKVFELRDSLPRESMGKVFKNELRAPYWEAADRRI